MTVGRSIRDDYFEGVLFFLGVLAILHGGSHNPRPLDEIGPKG